MSKAIESFKDIIRETGCVPTLEEFMEITGYKRDSYFRAKKDYLENGLSRLIDEPPYNNQIWKSIPEFENYLISNEAVVYNIKSNKILKPSLNRDGYYYVGLSKDGAGYGKFLHQLMGITFIPNPENKPTIDHINRIRTDNRIENLRWATSEEQGANMSTNIKIIDAITGKKYETLNSFQKEKERIDVKCIENNKIYQDWSSLVSDLFPNKKYGTVVRGVTRAIERGDNNYCGYTFYRGKHDYKRIKEAE